MLFNPVVRKATEAVDDPPPLDPAELVPLAELAADGFGWGGPYVQTPRDAIRVLADQLVGAVFADDLGRWCVTRDTARAMFAERAEAEQRQREAQERRDADLAAQDANNRPPTGVPADRVPDGVSPAAAMLQAALDAEPRRQSVLEEALANSDSLTYHPVRDES